jgi:serine/threonine protein kinase/Tol biopolymer transport system component
VRLAAGDRLGPYEIVAPLGAGGMGEVYRALDTRLGRDVAVKILSVDTSSSPDALQRFEREARTISQLSHPHICALYDVGEAPNPQSLIPNPYLVMELLDGETLAARLVKGPLPLEQTLRYGAAIADALDAAHRQGVVHRDLKPGNIMITKSGVKLLDFGLAKALEIPRSGELTSQLTAASPHDLTEVGTALGTPSYMAPEQIEGRPADARTDIFALGAVLCEMATGQKAFPGKSAGAVASAILRDDPPSIAASPSLDRLVRVCLAKDPEHRWQTARDVQLQLMALPTSGPVAVAAAATRARGRLPALLPWGIAALAGAVAVASVVRTRARAPSASPSAIRFSVPPPPGGTFWDNFENVPLALSPDGLQLAFVVTEASGAQRIWIRTLSAIDSRPVAETDGALSVIWSPDSRSIAFFAGGKLKRLDLAAGAAVTLCDFRGSGMSGTWGRDDQILFASVGGEAIYRVPASGGTPVEVLKPNAALGERRTVFPWYLPDGRRFLYSARLLDGAKVMLAEPGKEPRQVLSVVSPAQYVEPGYLVFVREGTLVGQRFDVERAALSGAPFSIASSVRYFYSTSAARFATAPGGALVHHTYVDQERLAWIDRNGVETGAVGPTGTYISMRISPDGGRVLFSRAQAQMGTFDLWMTDVLRGGEQRLTADPTSEVNGVWQRDGSSVFFGADRGGPPHLFRKDLRTGAEAEVLPAGGFQTAEDVSPDGRALAFSDRSAGRLSLWTIPVQGTPTKSALLSSAAGVSQVRFSPGGRFMAFTSNESGRNEVYISPYPSTGERTLASTTGGTMPRWSRDGRELFFVAADRRLTAIAVRTTPSLELGPPRPLFTVPGRRVWKDYDVSPDGSRFLAIVTDVRGDEQPLTVVLNWTAEAGRLDR